MDGFNPGGPTKGPRGDSGRPTHPHPYGDGGGGWRESPRGDGDGRGGGRGGRDWRGGGRGRGREERGRGGRGGRGGLHGQKKVFLPPVVPPSQEEGAEPGQPPLVTFEEFIADAMRAKELLVDRVQAFAAGEGLKDFHLEIFPDPSSGFQVTLKFGEHREGPFDYERCLSCLGGESASCPIEVGVWKKKTEEVTLSRLTNADTLVGQTDEGKFNWFIDGKARPMAVVCPAKHIETLTELGPEGLVSFWQSVAGLIRKFHIPFHNIIVNQGEYRNLPHLHAKIWFGEDEFQSAMRERLPEKYPIWEQLDALNEKMSKPEMEEVMKEIPERMRQKGVPKLFMGGIPRALSADDVSAYLEKNGFPSTKAFILPGKKHQMGALSATVEFPQGEFETAGRAICALAGAKPFGGSQRLFVKWARF